MSDELVERRLHNSDLLSFIQLTVVNKTYALRSNERILFNFNTYYESIFHTCIKNKTCNICGNSEETCFAL